MRTSIYHLNENNIEWKLNYKIFVIIFVTIRHTDHTHFANSNWGIRNE